MHIKRKIRKTNLVTKEFFLIYLFSAQGIFGRAHKLLN